MLSTKLKAAAGNSADATLYVDSVFSTWLYTGNGSTQTITNGIDLAGKGGMVWSKDRGQANNNVLQDTVRGVASVLSSNLSAGDLGYTNNITAFGSTGYSISNGSEVNRSTGPYASWTFRKAAKFFDVVTFSPDGSGNATINQSLGSAPGMIYIKKTSSTSNWKVYHRSLTTNYGLYLDTTDAADNFGTWIDVSSSQVNFYGLSPGTYVAYLFAHDTASDGIIQCGSYTTNGSGVITSPVNLGWEPQYILYKRVDAARNWSVLDSMRGNAVANGTQNFLEPNLSDAEITSYGEPSPLATGFTVTASTASSTYIYMAIRRPNKPPTSGTQVFSPVTYTGDGSTSRIITTGIITDLIIGGDRGNNGVGVGYTNDRLRGQANLITFDTSSEAVNSVYPKFDLMTGYNNNGATGGAFNASGFSYIRWAFRRAPGFFDVVCYTGTGSAQTIPHNLGVAPELLIFKARSVNGEDWVVLYPINDTYYYRLYLDLTNAGAMFGYGGSIIASRPTAASISLLSGTGTNTNTVKYVAYLFATLAGISKVGSYTGNGTTQTINCGFTGGARFVLIKRTDSTGDWYVFDTARGMTTLTDPYLLLNSTAAEVATLGAVTSVTTGFAVNAAIVAAINTNAASYIFLAIA